MMLLPWQQPRIIEHSQRLIHSYEYWTGTQLLPALAKAALARQLFESPFIVLSHGLEVDPILNYGNQSALDLWQIEWEQLIQMPSRLTAEPTERNARAQLLAEAATAGLIQNYCGIRVTRTGRRFLIENATIWDVLDEGGLCCGQAATFTHWQWLDSNLGQEPDVGICV
ncbi:MAG: MEKHLA domain-containing protein [Thermosynechococcaceae cyanobacterium]